MNIPGFPIEWISIIFILGVIMLVSRYQKRFLK
jgi:hypothetical protein